MLRFKFGAFQYYGSLETIISGSSEYRMGNERCVLCGRLLGGR